MSSGIELMPTADLAWIPFCPNAWTRHHEHACIGRGGKPYSYRRADSERDVLVGNLVGTEKHGSIALDFHHVCSALMAPLCDLIKVKKKLVSSQRLGIGYRLEIIF